MNINTPLSYVFFAMLAGMQLGCNEEKVIISECGKDAIQRKNECASPHTIGVHNLSLPDLHNLYLDMKAETVRHLDSTVNEVSAATARKARRIAYLARHGRRRTINSMAVVGDSISTGIFSDTSMGGKYTITFDLNMLFVENIRLEPFSVIGASVEHLMNGKNIFALPSLQSLYVKKIHEKVKHQYLKMGIFSSASPYSHASRLGLEPEAVQNLSVAGYKVRDILTKSLKYLDKEDYLILQIGANDFCHPEVGDLPRFEEDFKALLKTIYERPNSPLILIVPAPNMNTVYELTKGKQSFSADLKIPIFSLGAYTHHFESMSCPKIRGELGDRGYLLCPMFKNYDPAKVRNRQKEMNAAMERVVSDLDHEQRIVFAAAVSQPDVINAGMFAIDCFHPNRRGQEAIANAAWNSIVGKLSVKQEAGKGVPKAYE